MVSLQKSRWSKTGWDVTISPERKHPNYSASEVPEEKVTWNNDGFCFLRGSAFWKTHVHFLFLLSFILELRILEKPMLTFLEKLWHHRQFWFTGISLLSLRTDPRANSWLLEGRGWWRFIVCLFSVWNVWGVTCAFGGMKFKEGELSGVSLLHVYVPQNLLSV